MVFLPDQDQNDEPARGGSARWWGIGLLSLIVLLAAVIPKMIGVGIAGTPVATPVAQVPTPGDCVTGFGTNRSESPSATDPFPWARYGACGQSTFGEVVSVWVGVSTPATADPARPVGAQCPDAVGPLSGLSVMSRVNGGFLQWKPAIDVAVVPLGPDPGQRKLGRDYLACVAVVGNGQSAYRGSVRSGTLPPGAGICLSALPAGDLAEQSLAAVRTPCDAPHVGQLLAEVVQGTGRDPGEGGAESGCYSVAVLVTNRADPTDGGRLRLVAGSGAAPGCVAVVVGDGKLNGSLIGIGQQAVPWVR